MANKIMEQKYCFCLDCAFCFTSFDNGSGGHQILTKHSQKDAPALRGASKSKAVLNRPEARTRVGLLVVCVVQHEA